VPKSETTRPVRKRYLVLPIGNAATAGRVFSSCLVKGLIDVFLSRGLHVARLDRSSISIFHFNTVFLCGDVVTRHFMKADDSKKVFQHMPSLPSAKAGPENDRPFFMSLYLLKLLTVRGDLFISGNRRRY